MDFFETGFFVREAAWHGKGFVINKPPATSSEAIRLAGCDWEVGKEQLHRADGRPVKGAFATVRQSDDTVLGVVGERYTVLQNRDVFSWFDPFLASKACELHTGGSLLSGKRIWLQAEVGGLAGEVAPGDEVRAYLLLSHSHDESLAIDVRFTPIRVVCFNTLSAAREDGTAPHVSIKHTRGALESLEQVHKTIDLVRRDFSTSMEHYRFLASKIAVEDRTIEYVRRSFGKELDLTTGKIDKYRFENDVLGLVAEGTGQDNPAVRGTWWAAYNGVTEFIDRQRGRDESRFDQSWFGSGVPIRERAFDLALSYAKAA
jgi:phage/plasmid-like protein (TIGR03299 family)